MMSDMLRVKTAEIDRNLQYFIDVRPSLLPQHEGEYVLMRDAAVIDFFSTALDAQITGNQRFEDNRFSIQRVSAAADDLGYFSNALHHGAS